MTTFRKVPEELVQEIVRLFDEIVEECYENTLEDRPLLSVGIEEVRDKLLATGHYPKEPKP